MVTHSDEIAAYADRILHFRDGRIETDRPNGHYNHINTETGAEYASG
jgi:ABC-type lipoprotein export system ATPase subunit